MQVKTHLLRIANKTEAKIVLPKRLMESLLRKVAPAIVKIKINQKRKTNNARATERMRLMVKEIEEWLILNL